MIDPAEELRKDVAAGMAGQAARRLVGVAREALVRDVHRVFAARRAGGVPQAVLLDFGIARSNDPGSTMTSTGFVVGTAGYIAPEISLGGRAFDARADLYRLGVVLYEALVGAPPFVAANPFALAARQSSEDPLSPRHREPTVPEDVDELVMRLLARDPMQRPSSAARVVERVAALLRRGTKPLSTAEGAPLFERNEFLELSFDPMTRIVRYLRTATPFPSADDVGQSYGVVSHTYPAAVREDKALLIDLRAAPLRTDPRFAKIVTAEMPRLLDGWRRVATLVATDEGRQQLAELRARAGLAGDTFLDEDAALAFLLAETDRP